MAGEEACGPLLDRSGPSKMGRPAFWLVDRREKKKKTNKPKPQSCFIISNYVWNRLCVTLGKFKVEERFPSGRMKQIFFENVIIENRTHSCNNQTLS